MALCETWHLWGEHRDKCSGLSPSYRDWTTFPGPQCLSGHRPPWACQSLSAQTLRPVPSIFTSSVALRVPHFYCWVTTSVISHLPPSTPSLSKPPHYELLLSTSLHSQPFIGKFPSLSFSNFNPTWLSAETLPLLQSSPMVAGPPISGLRGQVVITFPYFLLLNCLSFFCLWCACH